MGGKRRERIISLTARFRRGLVVDDEEEVGEEC
jgi:hypothetical protein